MALNRLTIAEMVMLFEDWVTVGHPVRIALEQNPGLAALLPHIEGAHAALVNTQPVELMAARAQLTEALGDKDERFDNLARAIDSVFDAHLALALANGDDTSAAALRSLKRIVLPHQLRVITMSYREEAGQTALLAERLTADHEALLAELPVRGSNLLELVRTWLVVGAELGALAHQRADLGLPSRQNSQTRARSMWIKAVRTIRSVVGLTGVSDPRIEEGLGRISAAELAAERRARSAAVEGSVLVGSPAEESDGDASDGALPGGDVPGEGEVSTETPGEVPVEVPEEVPGLIVEPETAASIATM